MTPLMVESFELYQGTSSSGFVEYLESCGYTVSGPILPAPDRSGFTVAADLSAGGISFPASSLDPIVAFGFAARFDVPGSVWRLTDDLVLAVGDYPELGGVAGTNRISANRWLYFEVVIDKGTNLAELYINSQRQVQVSLPTSLRFLTAFRPTFEARDGFIIDDVYAAAGGRMGPISATAHFGDADLPWGGDSKGDQLSSTVTDSAPESDIKLIAVKARVSRTDLDNRRVATFAGDQVREVSVSTESRYKQGLYAAKSNGSPWTTGDIASLEYGVRITN